MPRRRGDPDTARRSGRGRPAPTQPEQRGDQETYEQRRAEDREGAEIGSAARVGVGIVDEIVCIHSAQHGAGAEEARLDAVPAVGVGMAERNIGVARQPACHFELICRKAGRVGDAGRGRKVSGQLAGHFVRVLQHVIPAPQRGVAEAAHRVGLGSRQALQRKQRVAVELDAIVARIKGFERDPFRARQPRDLPRGADRGVDCFVGERGGDAAGFDCHRLQLRGVDPLGAQRGGELDFEDVAGRQAGELCLAERGG